MTIFSNRDIVSTYRHNDYSQDVYVNGLWIASAKTCHGAEEVADEAQYRTFLYEVDPPTDIPDEYPDPTPGGPEPPEYRTTPLLVDVAHVLGMVLGNGHVSDVIPELRRVNARVQAAIGTL